MSDISSKGGMFKGDSHEDGGIPIVVEETKQSIEVEGEEALIPVEIANDPKIYEFKGTNRSILNQILKAVGAKTLDRKATEVHAGDMIICVRSTADKDIHQYKGTLKEIVSKINESGGCNVIVEGGEQLMKDGGVTKKTLKIKKPISKMTKHELVVLMGKVDPIKSSNMNWFKGTTTKGLRNRVEFHLSKKYQFEIDPSKSKFDDGGLTKTTFKSNLTPEQQKLVRTPEFKAWFGNWENDPENSSKVVDENGEPLVVYHGSVSRDIDIFDRNKSTRVSSGLKEYGIYFATNKELAKLYSQTQTSNEHNIEVAQKIRRLRDELLKTKNNADFDAITNEIEALTKYGRTYPVFLNLRKIQIFDAKEETNIEAWHNLEVKASYKWASGRDAMDFLKEGKFGVSKVDGVKAENIIDMSIGGSYKDSQAYKDAREKYLGDVYLVFDGQPQNIKLADGSNITFDGDNPDIRFEGGGSAETELEKGTKVEMEHKDTVKKLSTGKYTAKEAAEMIAKDHLKESDKYYTHLDEMESKFDDGGLTKTIFKSNLTPEQQKLVRTPEFKKWFGDWENDPENASKVVDENGEPKVVYHGVDKNVVGFNKFHTAYSKHDRNVGYWLWHEFGAFFTDSYDTALDYAWKGKNQNSETLAGEVKSFFLNIRKPLIEDLDGQKWYKIIPHIFAKKNYANDKRYKGGIYTPSNDTYDGFIVSNIDEMNNPHSTTYHIKKSSQAKLADGTNTSFKVSSLDVRFDDGGQVYPLEDVGKWYGDSDYELTGGKLIYMSPDEYLSKAKPLDIDEGSRENIEDLKQHIIDGHQLDPLALYSNDITDVRASDGRHRAYAAKELSIKEVPVIDFTNSSDTTLKEGGEAEGLVFKKVDYKSLKSPAEAIREEQRIARFIKKLEGLGYDSKDDLYWDMIEYRDDVYSYRKDLQRKISNNSLDMLYSMNKSMKDGGKIEKEMVDKKPTFDFLKENPMQQARAISALSKLVTYKGKNIYNYEFIEGLDKGLEIDEEVKLHSSKSEKGYVMKKAIGDTIIDSKAEIDYYKYLEDGGEPYSEYKLKLDEFNKNIQEQKSKIREIEKANRDEEQKEIYKKSNDAKTQQIKRYLEEGKDWAYTSQFLDTIEDLKKQKQSKSRDEEIEYQLRRHNQMLETIEKMYELANSHYKIVNGKVVEKFDFKVGDDVFIWGYDVIDSKRVPKKIFTTIEEVNTNALGSSTYKVKNVEGVINQYVGYTAIYPKGFKEIKSEQINYESGNLKESAKKQAIKETKKTLGIETQDSSINEEMEKPKSEKFYRKEPKNKVELKESLEYLQENQGTDTQMWGVQNYYFNNIVSENIDELTNLLEVSDELGLKKKQRYDLYLYLSEAGVLDKDQIRFLTNLNNSGKTIYDLVPEKDKKVNKKKALPISPRPDNENLSKITDLFVGIDDLRPAMTGVFFDKENNRIACTNAHILLIINEKPDVKESSICLMGKQLNKQIKDAENSGLDSGEAKKYIDLHFNEDTCWEITSGQYPQLDRVIPRDFESVVPFDALKMLSYIKAGIKEYSNKTTLQLIFTFENNDNETVFVGFNGELLRNAIEGMFLLGHDDLEICFTTSPSDKAFLIVPKGNSRKVGYNSIDTDMVLVMPVMIRDEIAAPSYKPVYNLDLNTITTYGNPKGGADLGELDLRQNEQNVKDDAEKHLSTLRSILNENYYSKSGYKVTPRLNWRLNDVPYFLIEKETLEGKYQIDVSLKSEVDSSANLQGYYFDVRMSIWLDDGFVNPHVYVNEWADNDIVSKDIYELLVKNIDGDHISLTQSIHEPEKARAAFNNLFKIANDAIKHDEAYAKGEIYDYNNLIQPNEIEVVSYVSTDSKNELKFIYNGRFFVQTYNKTGSSGFKFIEEYPNQYTFDNNHLQSGKKIYTPYDSEVTPFGKYLEFSLSKMPKEVLRKEKREPILSLTDGVTGRGKTFEDDESVDKNNEKREPILSLTDGVTGRGKTFEDVESVEKSQIVEGLKLLYNENKSQEIADLISNLETKKMMDGGMIDYKNVSEFPKTNITDYKVGQRFIYDSYRQDDDNPSSYKFNIDRFGKIVKLNEDGGFDAVMEYRGEKEGTFEYTFKAEELETPVKGKFAYILTAYTPNKMENGGFVGEGRERLIVVDEHTLAYQQPHQYSPENKYPSANVLRASVLKGSNFHNGQFISLFGHTVRLASERDFENFNTVFGSFGDEEKYEFAKMEDGGSVDIENLSEEEVMERQFGIENI